MQKIHNNDGVVHLWANQAQSEARNGKDSFSFHGGNLYSYATMIAAFITPDLILFNSATYSVTTSQQIGLAQSAASHIDSLVVPNMGSQSGGGYDAPQILSTKDHAENLKFFKDNATDALLRSGRARSNADWLYSEAMSAIDNYNHYLSAFKIKRKQLTPDQFNVKDLVEKAKIASKKGAKKRKIERAKLAKEQAENIAEWIAGNSYSFSGSNRLPVYLRINESSETIETSQGANIPLKFAPILWRMINKTIRVGEQWTKDPTHAMHVGHYTLDRINVDGSIVVGCHNIPFSELERMAAILGYKTGGSDNG